MLRWVLLAPLAACASSAAPAREPPAPKLQDDRGAAFEAALTGERLARLGSREGSVDALVTAARLLAEYPPRALTLAFEREPGAPSRAPSPPSASPERALAAARELAAVDPAMAAHVDAARRTLPAARGSGPARGTRDLGPGGRDFAVVAGDEVGAVGEVAVIGDGQSDLDLWVFDRDGRLVCADTEPSDVARCRWLAGGGAPFDVVVKNVGARASAYAFLLR